MYADPLYVAAEVAYRRERLTTTGSQHLGASRRHGHGWADRLHLRMPHRHIVEARPA